jgi:hypothetical protein
MSAESWRSQIAIDALAREAYAASRAAHGDSMPDAEIARSASCWDIPPLLTPAIQRRLIELGHTSLLAVTEIHGFNDPVFTEHRYSVVGQADRMPRSDDTVVDGTYLQYFDPWTDTSGWDNVLVGSRTEAAALMLEHAQYPWAARLYQADTLIGYDNRQS